MDDDAITAIVGWPTEPQMAKYRAVAQAAIAIEREACAKTCEDIGKDIVCPEECAAAIRARFSAELTGQGVAP